MTVTVLPLTMTMNIIQALRNRDSTGMNRFSWQGANPTSLYLWLHIVAYLIMVSCSLVWLYKEQCIANLHRHRALQSNTSPNLLIVQDVASQKVRRLSHHLSGILSLWCEGEDQASRLLYTRTRDQLEKLYLRAIRRAVKAAKSGQLPFMRPATPSLRILDHVLESSWAMGHRRRYTMLQRSDPQDMTRLYSKQLQTLRERLDKRDGHSSVTVLHFRNRLNAVLGAQALSGLVHKAEISIVEGDQYAINWSVIGTDGSNDSFDELLFDPLQSVSSFYGSFRLRCVRPQRSLRCCLDTLAGYVGSTIFLRGHFDFCRGFVHKLLLL